MKQNEAVPLASMQYSNLLQACVWGVLAGLPETINHKYQSKASYVKGLGLTHASRWGGGGVIIIFFSVSSF